MRRLIRLTSTACAVYLLVLSGGRSAAGNGPLVLVQGGKSDYVICREERAPESVQRASWELQRMIYASTGARLPIRTAPAEPMISLGQNAAAKRAGLDLDKAPDDTFRIVTRGRNLFIVGKDVPPEKAEWRTWFSRGTLFGTYDFLEENVGVRWLLPGKWGTFVPKRATLVVKDADRRESPDFQVRRIANIQDFGQRWGHLPVNGVKNWLWRHKCQSEWNGRKMRHGHSWVHYITPAMLNRRPEFRAKDGGPRKICTTHPEVIKLFAKNLIARIDERPGERCFSISPTDGGNFCRCERCMALVTKDRYGWETRTAAMLTFANEIARRVAKVHPDRLLAMYLYYNYMYPPPKPMEVEPNLRPHFTPLRYYGWGLAKPEYRDEFAELVKAWKSMVPHLMYHNYSTWMRDHCGAPLPPGLDILKLELPTLRKHGVEGAEMVGMGAWGYGAVNNYILAKQMWDADIDVEATYREWLRLAYGPGWREMDEIYMHLESELIEHKRDEGHLRFSGATYEVNAPLIAKIWRPYFPTMEKRYFRALAKAKTRGQRERLNMFAENLTVFNYQMWKAGLITHAQAKASRFYLDDEQFKQFYDDAEFSISLYRNHGQRTSGKIWKDQWTND